jgi:hypothetical protein
MSRISTMVVDFRVLCAILQTSRVISSVVLE